MDDLEVLIKTAEAFKRLHDEFETTVNPEFLVERAQLIIALPQKIQDADIRREVTTFAFLANKQLENYRKCPSIFFGLAVFLLPWGEKDNLLEKLIKRLKNQ